MITSCPTFDAWPWCDPSVPLEARVDGLLAAIEDEELPPLLSSDLFGGAAGVARLNVSGYSWISEADHGVLKVNCTPMPTAYPQAISLAATFNESLWAAVGQVSAAEARVLYGLPDTQYGGRLLNGLLLHINVNLFRDPRWGRGQETPGEDPYLSSRYARRWVEGVQAAPKTTSVVAGAACKHLAAYSLEGAAPHSRHSFDALVTAQDLEDSFYPAFRSCAASDAMGLMCAYNALNGTPACADGSLLGLARGAWNFSGVVVTDCDAMLDVYSEHHFVANRSEAVRASLAAGTDVDCGTTLRDFAVLAEVAPLLRTAARRTLRVRFRLGEFDPPQPPQAASLAARHAVRCNTFPVAHAHLAFEAALQSITLLKNSVSAAAPPPLAPKPARPPLTPKAWPPLLPLPKGLRLAVLGPLANATGALLGDYSSRPACNSSITTSCVPVPSVLQALRESGHADVVTVPAASHVGLCDVNGSIGRIEVPRGVDAVVVVAGLMGDFASHLDPETRPPTAECQSGCLEAEGCDRPSLAWPAAQRALLEQVASWGLPTVLIVVSGGPLLLEEFASHPAVRAIVWAGYPGQQGARALASLLFGAASFTGRLPQTFYTANYTPALPMPSMALRPSADGSRPGRTHRFVDPSYVVYPFGFGLTYEVWGFSWAPPSSVVPAPSCDASVALALAPPATRASLTVLLFLVPPASAGNTAPRRELRRFARQIVDVESLQSRTARVGFTLHPDDFRLANERGAWAIVPGTWTVEISEPAELRKTLVVDESGACVPNYFAAETPEF